MNRDGQSVVHGSWQRVDERHGTTPPGRRALDLDREATYGESVRRQSVQVDELLHLEIADLATCLVSLPENGSVLRSAESFEHVLECGIPAIGIGAHHAHTSFQQPHRGLTSQAART